MNPREGEYPDHGDGFGDYYGIGTSRMSYDVGRRRSKYREERSTTRSKTSDSRSRSRSKSRSRSRSKSRSRSRSRSKSHSKCGSQQREFNLREPSFLDAFRVLYLIPRNSKSTTSKYLITKKRQDRIQEILKSDGLGSKRWLFYPRPHTKSASLVLEPRASRETCDQRVKVDGVFFRKLKRSKKVVSQAPIAKLKWWELSFYKKIGFIHSV